MPLQRTVLLPAMAFRQAWEWEIRAEPPTALGRNDHWVSGDAKRQLEDETLDVLASVGLAAGGTLTHDFRDALATLARGYRFSAYVGDIHNDRTGTAVVAASGPVAVRAICVNDLVRIDPVPAEAVVESLIEVLPAMSPARLDPLAIPKSRYRPDGPVMKEHYEFSMSTRQPQRDLIERPRKLMAAPRLGLHQLYAGKSDPVTVVDVAGEGRVITFVTQAPREEAKVHFLPGTREQLIGAVRGRTAA
ncbi:MAG TPA: ESX secretion-associated protein EspG [Amycolatopsis sp.]|nr:ESX secretion-associated protein EspG [Amycolatopsis sp.]